MNRYIFTIPVNSIEVDEGDHVLRVVRSVYDGKYATSHPPLDIKISVLANSVEEAQHTLIEAWIPPKEK